MTAATTDRSRPNALAALVLGAGLLVLALVTRLPFRDRTLFIADAVRYALALEHYDMSLGRPHPPGSPLYVGIVAVAFRLLGDAPLALAVVAALGSGFAFWFAYLLARDVAGEAAGWLAAGLLLASPLFWYFGGVGMPATGEAALSLGFAWLARRARSPVETGAFVAMTLVLALAFGYRSTFAVFVLPLWVLASWRHPPLRIAAGLAFLGLAAVGWIAVVAALSGGFHAWRASSSAFFSEVVVGTKLLGGGLAKVPIQVKGIAIALGFALGPFLVPFAIGVKDLLAGRPPFPGALPFLAAWTLPMLAFHLVYEWAPRFGVVLMAPAVVLTAAAAVPFARTLARRSQGSLAAALVVLGLALEIGLFLLPARIGPITLPEAYPGGPSLLARNDDLARRDLALRARFDPAHTLVLAYDHAFHGAWFLPEFRVVGLFPLFKPWAEPGWVPSARGHTFSFEPGSSALPAGSPLAIPTEIEDLVLYDPDYVAFWPSATLPLEAIPYDGTRVFHVAHPPGPGCLEFAYAHLTWRAGGCGATP